MSFTPITWQTGSWLFLAAACTAAIVYTDIRYYWIPDLVVLMLFGINGAACWLGWFQPDWGFSFFCLAALALIRYFRPGSIGRGDVKLLAVLALGSSGCVLYVTLCLAFFSALLTGFLLWLFTKRTMLPFGPFLLGSWWFSVIFSEECSLWLSTHVGL